MLTQYYITNQDSDFKSDNYEKAADVLLKPLRFVFGNVVKIDQTGKFTKLDQVNVISRIFIATVSSIFFFVTVPALVAGTICVLNSKSHKKFTKLETFQLNTIPPNNAPSHRPLEKKTENIQNIIVENKIENEILEPINDVPEEEDPIIPEDIHAENELISQPPFLIPDQIIDDKIPEQEANGNERLEEKEKLEQEEEKEVPEPINVVQEEEDPIIPEVILAESEPIPSTPKQNEILENSSFEKEIPEPIVNASDETVDIQPATEIIQEANELYPRDISPESYPSWKKTYTLGALALAGVPLAYYAYTQADMSFVVDMVNQLYANVTNEETVNSIIAPFANNIGLPFIRSACYVTAGFLATKKTTQGVAALGLNIASNNVLLKKRVNDAFWNTLIRDVFLITGLVGTGLLVEGFESDLNLYLQQLEINEKPLSKLLDSNFTGFVSGMRTALFGANEPVSATQPVACTQIAIGNPQNLPTWSFNTEAYLNKLRPLFDTAVYSMKRLRLTPLKSYSILEQKYGIPLSRIGFTKNLELSEASRFFTQTDFKELAQNIKNGMTLENLNRSVTTVGQTLTSLYENSIEFMESPRLYTTDYVWGIVNRTMAWQTYVSVLEKTNTIKNYVFI